MEDALVDQVAPSEVLGEPQVELMDIEPVFTGEGLDIEQLFAARKEIFLNDKLRTKLCEIVEGLGSGGADSNQLIKLGFAYWILNRLDEAVTTLGAASDPIADYFIGLLHLEQDSPKKALPSLERVAKQTDDIKITCTLIEARTKLGEVDESLSQLDELAKSNGQSAEVHYQRGLALHRTGEYETSLEAYQKALELDENHAPAAFQLGYGLALRGQEEEALEYYQKCLNIGPARASLLINIGLLYEDARQYEKAIRCYEEVIRGDGTHERARLYLKDALASLNMYYDEDKQGEMERRSDLLNLPVSDFELSVRCRTALESIGINSVSDLVTRTEQELLSCKNFGETSLREIKMVLAQRGLRLGMSSSELFGEHRAVVGRPGDQNILDKLVGELDLSVRSRRCMERLGIVTLRDLTEKSERELLSGKNFGRTSLKEIKEKLAGSDLKLADDPED